MKIALITDIHEDIARLEKAIKHIRAGGFDRIVCLGDITGFTPQFYKHTPDANACIDLIKSEADIVVAGNHDLFTAQRLPRHTRNGKIPEDWYDLSAEDRIRLSRNKIWLYLDEVSPRLSTENEAYLSGLKEWEILNSGDHKFMFTHFIKPNISGYSRWFPFMRLQIREHLKFMQDENCTFSFAGHWHPPAPVIINRFFWSAPRQENVRLKHFQKSVICPALSGGKYPGAYTGFDTRNFHLQMHLI
jgi:predicted phosphodiesterase